MGAMRTPDELIAKVEKEGSVALTELAQNLSAMLKIALKRPLAVTRRNRLAAFFVSHHIGYKEPRVEDYISDTHPLRNMREGVDWHLREMDAVLRRFESKEQLAAQPEMLCRAILLQLLYSISNPRILHQKIHYNLEFRAFVGYPFQARRWLCDEFVHDVDVMLGTSVMVDLWDRLVDSPRMPNFSHDDFFVDHALLREWRRRCERALAPRSTGVLSDAMKK